MYVRTIALAATTAVGLTLTMLPTAADWFARRAHDTIRATYATTIDQMSDGERDDLLNAAHAYNESLVNGTAVMSSADDDVLYRSLLSTGTGAGIGEFNMMANLEIPSINVSILVFHGTDEEVLAAGAGHLYGTSLPVGGPGTDAVISAHSGMTSAKLFTALHDVKVGDTFTIHVTGAQLLYQVDDITVVTPQEVDELKPIPGEDHVTLMTCTPIGQNTHRLLVRGTRIDEPSDAAPGLPLTVGTAGFPGWALVIAVGTLVVGGVAEVLGRRARRDDDTDDDTEPNLGARHADATTGRSVKRGGKHAYA